MGEGGAHECHPAEHDVSAQAGAGEAAQHHGEQRAGKERFAQRFADDLKHGGGRGLRTRDWCESYLRAFPGCGQIAPGQRDHVSPSPRWCQFD